jgi:hypothetical protein
MESLAVFSWFQGSTAEICGAAVKSILNTVETRKLPLFSLGCIPELEFEDFADVFV